MARNLILGGAALLALLSAAACVSPANQGVGLLHASVRGPLWASTEPLPATVARGQSQAYTFLGLFAWGDATLAAAMSAGGIGTLHHADYEYEQLLGLMAVYRVHAVGAPLAEGAAPSAGGTP